MQSGLQPSGSIEKQENSDENHQSDSIPKDEESKPDEVVGTALAKYLDYQIQRSSNSTSPKLNTYLAGGRIDSLGILALAAEKRRELELMYVIFRGIFLFPPAKS